jgi:hypothetical protein
MFWISGGSDATPEGHSPVGRLIQGWVGNGGLFGRKLFHDGVEDFASGEPEHPMRCEDGADQRYGLRSSVLHECTHRCSKTNFVPRDHVAIETRQNPRAIFFPSFPLFLVPFFSIKIFNHSTVAASLRCRDGITRRCHGQHAGDGALDNRKYTSREG